MDISKIWDLLKGLSQQADKILPGATGKEKKAWCVDKVLEFTNYLEVLMGIGGWANLAIVDGFERFIIGLGVERAWTELQLPDE